LNISEANFSAAVECFSHKTPSTAVCNAIVQNWGVNFQKEKPHCRYWFKKSTFSTLSHQWSTSCIKQKTMINASYITFIQFTTKSFPSFPNQATSW